MKLLSNAPWLLGSLLAVTACSVGPKYSKPETPVAANFSNGKHDSFANVEPAIQWWHRFDDSELNHLVDQALANNKDLKIAAARVDEAMALARVAHIALFPTVTSDASYTRTHESRVERIPLPGVTGNTQVLDFGLQETWEIDLWGRVRNSYKAAKADLEANNEQRNDTMVSLISDVGRLYLELRGLQNELAVALQNVQNQKETVELTENLLKGGRGTELDTSRALAQLKTTEATVPPLQSAISKDAHAIAVLLGEQPQVLEKELLRAKPIPSLPTLVRIGKPESLLRRRPDVRVAERSLEAASLRINVATADLFPKVTFNGTVDLQAKNFSGLSGPGSGASSFGPGISWPALDIWRVKALVDVAKAREREQLATYEKTVLTALQETEDALTDYGYQRARRGFLSEAAEASEKAARLARERFKQGAADFLTVLDAERTMLQAQSDLAVSETGTATAIVAVYKALGGGWESPGRDVTQSSK